ncbi:MAG: hypothetical protein HXY42_14275 [Chloroflexi bacterium]|mgnify:CR=1 FL=1|jgi:hypothetical protein|nr:hypothetical protein [Chloroflexota bacterium]
MKRIVIFSLLASLALTACGTAAPAEPTINPQDIQSTAVAAAFTIVAETQAAIPTNTPLPPTDTPVPTPIPTDTPIPLPTLDPLTLPTFTPVPTAANAVASADPCQQPLQAVVTGQPTKIRLINKTKGTLVVSLFLNLTPFGECGYRGYNMSVGDRLIITDLVTGCYNVGVFVTEPNKSSKAFGYGCINNSDMWTFEIYNDTVKFIGP